MYNDKCAVVLQGNYNTYIGCSNSYCIYGDEEDDLYDDDRTVCCCNTTNCNDDAFVERCKARAASKPKRITCQRLLPDEDGKKCSGMFNI